MRKGKSVRQEDGTERVVRTTCLRSSGPQPEERGCRTSQANEGGETGDDALHGEQGIKTDSRVSRLGEVKNAGVTDRSGVIREVMCRAGGRYCSAYRERRSRCWGNSLPTPADRAVSS